MRETENLIFAFDNDAPGRTAALRMLDLCRKTGVECKFFNYDGVEYKDIGEMTDNFIHRGIEAAKHCVLGKAAILGE
jgi:DNA primase